MKKLSHKIIAMAVGICIIISSAMAFTSVLSLVRTNDRYIAKLETLLKENYDKLNRLQVETAVSMMAEINRMGEKGELTQEQAKKLSADLLRQLRYGEEGYFWADTIDGTNVVLLGNETEGTNRYNAKDANGNLYIQDIIKNGMQEGGGYSEYWFPKKGTTEPLPKRSYSVMFKPYGWVVGTGTYVDDIQKELLLQKEEAASKIKYGILTLLVMAVIALIVGFAIAVIMGNKISKPITVLTALFKRAEQGDLTVRSNIKSKDEIGQLSYAFNYMMENMAGFIR